MPILLALGQLLFLEAGFAVVQSAWHNHFIGPAGRIGSIVLVALVIGLPWVVHPRSVFGPVEASRPARLVRFGGYALLFLLIPVILAVVEYGNARFGPAGPRSGSGGAVVLAVIFLGYSLTILGLTSRRWPIPPRTLAVGGGFGVAVGVAVEMRKGSIVGRPVLLGILLFALTSPGLAQKSEPRPQPLDPVQGEKEARTLVADLLSRKPEQNTTNTGVLKIRDGDDKKREVPVRFEVFANPSDWVSVYETTPAGGAEKERR